MPDVDFPRSDVRIDSLRKLGEGREAEVFRWNDTAALKLAHQVAARPRLAAEATAMRAAEVTGVQMARLLGTVELEGRPGIIMELLDGPDQLTLLSRRPWMVWSVGRNLGRLHARLHSTTVGHDLRSLRDALRIAIGESPLVPDDVKRTALSALERLPDGDFVCHGDFHPGNVVETGDGPKVIDWANATRGDRLADLARTAVMFSGDDVGSNPPLLLRILNRFGRRIVWLGYSRTYRRLRPYRKQELDAWIPVVAAQRLTEQIPGEREHLLQLARSQRR